MFSNSRFHVRLPMCPLKHYFSQTVIYTILDEGILVAVGLGREGSCLGVVLSWEKLFL